MNELSQLADIIASMLEAARTDDADCAAESASKAIVDLGVDYFTGDADTIVASGWATARELADAYFDGSISRGTVDVFGVNVEELADDEQLAVLAVVDCHGGDFADYSVDGTGAYGYGYCVSNGNTEYSVMEDSEAAEAWENSIDNYIDDCILPEMGEFAARYFDYEAFKRDARFDGRGHSLASYDGNEEEAQVAGKWLFIYRTN